MGKLYLVLQGTPQLRKHPVLSIYSLSQNCLRIENSHVPTARDFKMTIINFPVTHITESSGITKKSDRLLGSKNNYIYRVFLK
jgi:hypothetical protein